MIIFIDTNILFKADFFRSATALFFLKAAKFLEIEVIIPEIVIDEIKGNFFQELPKRLEKYKKELKNLNQLIDISDTNIDIEKETEKYEAWLDKLLEEYEVNILSYPENSVKDLVVNSYKGKKPFKNNGDGHKDYVIWETIKKYITEQKDDPETYFLTDNILDFCEKQDDDNWPLHPHLSTQITDEKTAPEVYRKFKKFFNEKIVPKLKDIELKSIQQLTQIKLYEEAQRIVENDLQNYSAFGIEGLSFCNEVTIYSAFDATPDHIELKGIDNEETLITVSGLVFVEATGCIDKHDYISCIEYDNIDINVIEGNWNDHFMLVSQIIETPFNVNFSYSIKEDKITGHSVELTEEIV